MSATEATKKPGGRRLNAALSARAVKAAKAPGRYFDGHGLFLLVTPGGGKLWKQRVAIHGRRVELGLGGYPVVTLAAAREAAVENRRMARAGRDPRIERRRAKAESLTFVAAAREVYKLHASNWRNAKHAHEWMATLERFVFPKIGDRPVTAVDVQDVIDVLMPIWRDRPVTAKRVGQRIGMVCTWAIAQRLRTDNPADAAKVILPKQAAKVKRHRALAYGDVAGALATMRESTSERVTVLALEFLTLTAARAGEVRFATWNEINMVAATWTVPGERMKAGSDHRVPLSPRALEILAEARTLPGAASSELVFPSRQRKPISESAFVHALDRNGIESTAHGFRSSFRVWAAERTNIPREVCEAALAHTIKDKAEAAYQRSDLFERRRELMNRWAAYLADKPAAVVSIATGRAVS